MSLLNPYLLRLVYTNPISLDNLSRNSLQYLQQAFDSARYESRYSLVKEENSNPSRASYESRLWSLEEISKISALHKAIQVLYNRVMIEIWGFTENTTSLDKAERFYSNSVKESSFVNLDPKSPPASTSSDDEQLIGSLERTTELRSNLDEPESKSPAVTAAESDVTDGMKVAKLIVTQKSFWKICLLSRSYEATITLEDGTTKSLTRSHYENYADIIGLIKSISSEKITYMEYNKDIFYESERKMPFERAYYYLQSDDSLDITPQHVSQNLQEIFDKRVSIESNSCYFELFKECKENELQKEFRESHEDFTEKRDLLIERNYPFEEASELASKFSGDSFLFSQAFPVLELIPKSEKKMINKRFNPSLDL